MSSPDPISDFMDAMNLAGVRPVEPIADKLGPKLIRFECEGDGRGRQNGWAVLYLDGLPAGAFGNYRLQISEKWRASSTSHQTAAERSVAQRRYAAERHARDAERQAEQERVAETCRKRWEYAGRADPAHFYLQKKRISGEGLRQDGNRLLVPMVDADGIIWNLQAIAPDGSKRFQKGGRQQGLFFLLGEPDAAIAIAEGYATGAVVRRATSLATAIAFSAANLKAVAIVMRGRFPDFDIIVAADDDAHLINNPHIARNVGIDAALAAAQAVGSRVAIPPCEEDR